MFKVTVKLSPSVTVEAETLSIVTCGFTEYIYSVSSSLQDETPNTTRDEQWKLRYHRVGVALDALTEDVKEQTVFRV